MYGAQAADGFYHTFAGWVVFVVAFLLLAIEGGAVSQLSKRLAMYASGGTH